MSTVLKNKIVTTRKPHICHGCYGMFPIGSKMKYLSGVDGGAFWGSYWCEHCCDRLYEMDYEYYEIGCEDGFEEGIIRTLEEDGYFKENGDVL